jgi:hypothetical protein
MNHIRPELVFRGPEQKCAHNPNEISPFRPELVFRDVPGKFTQRHRQTQRFRRLLPRTALLNPVARGVVRVPRPPARLRLSPPRRLARRLAARVLPVSNTRVGPEPPAADRAGSLPSVSHGDLSNHHAIRRVQWMFRWRKRGSLLVSKGGEVLASAEVYTVSWDGDIICPTVGNAITRAPHPLVPRPPLETLPPAPFRPPGVP